MIQLNIDISQHTIVFDRGCNSKVNLKKVARLIFTYEKKLAEIADVLYYIKIMGNINFTTFTSEKWKDIKTGLNQGQWLNRSFTLIEKDGRIKRFICWIVNQISEIFRGRPIYYQGINADKILEMIEEGRQFEKISYSEDFKDFMEAFNRATKYRHQEKIDLLTAPVLRQEKDLKDALITDFMKTMEDLGVNDLSRTRIAYGSLDLKIKLSHLEENKKTQVLKAACKLTFLTNLYLSSNQISSIPAEIEQLSQLQKLDLSFNQISSIPAEIGQLSQLQKLDLSYNQISSIPAEIGQLSQLQTLYLSSNQISSIPAEIGQLSQLRNLHLRRNQISSIPAEIGQLSRLQELSFSDNQISSISAEIGQLSQLRNLYLCNNPLRELPLSLKSISEITTF